MSNPRISVSQFKQLMQLRANQMTTRSIARALSLSQGAVSKYGRAVFASCQTWEAALKLEETEFSAADTHTAFTMAWNPCSR
jgi:predicted transcriptional regulator